MPSTCAASAIECDNLCVQFPDYAGGYVFDCASSHIADYAELDYESSSPPTLAPVTPIPVAGWQAIATNAQCTPFFLDSLVATQSGGAFVGPAGWYQRALPLRPAVSTVISLLQSVGYDALRFPNSLTDLNAQSAQIVRDFIPFWPQPGGAAYT